MHAVNLVGDGVVCWQRRDCLLLHMLQHSLQGEAFVGEAGGTLIWSIKVLRMRTTILRWWVVY